MATKETDQPLIVVPTAQIGSTLKEEPPLWAMRSSYVGPLLKAGALPIFLPQITDLHDLAPLFGQAHGLLLAGGADIHPDLYGSVPEKNLEETDPARDHSEYLVTKWAIEQKLPILAICRGAQMVNVAAGGTLHQDIPTDLNLPTEHRRQPVTYANLAHHGHLIRIEPTSRFSRIVEHAEVWVNSMHHQAIDRLGTGLVVVAKSADGVIEAIEAEDPTHWLVGIQGHPEAMVGHDPWAAKLFETFVAVARDFASSPD